MTTETARLVRLLVPAADLAAARLISDCLAAGDWPPLAVTEFETAPNGPWRVDAYYDAEADMDAVRAALAGDGIAAADVAVEAVPDENWVAVSQAALPPVEAGRFVVHGSHDRERIGRRHSAILIDAGEAFGTAHHATTEGCLVMLDRLVRRRRFGSVLDLGCGSGVLAIAAARMLPRARVLATDIDPVAIEVARENIRRNNAAPRVHALTAAGLAHARVRGAGPYDLVLANILAGPLITLAPAMAGVVRPGGRAVLSGILAEQAREVWATYVAAGFRLETRRVRNGWATLVLVRQPRIRCATRRSRVRG